MKTIISTKKILFAVILVSFVFTSQGLAFAADSPDPTLPVDSSSPIDKYNDEANQNLPSTGNKFQNPQTDATKDIQAIGEEISVAENKLKELSDSYSSLQLRQSTEKIAQVNLKTTLKGITKEKENIEIAFADQSAKTFELATSNESISQNQSSKEQIEYQASQDYVKSLQIQTHVVYEKIAKTEKNVSKKLDTLNVEVKKVDKAVNNYAKQVVELQDQVDEMKLEAKNLKETFISNYREIGTPVLVEGRICPIAGPVTHSDDWGNARNGGRRHMGNDVFNPFGVPNVAIVGGTISRSDSGLGGKGVSLKGDDGYDYYYAHLSAFAAEAGRVEQGEVIGFTGVSGNAIGGTPHTHMQIKKIGGALFNPYPTVRALCSF
jgi:murein DD-endopeptidase MepM/ murein hydrolase activator NlpD